MFKTTFVSTATDTRSTAAPFGYNGTTVDGNNTCITTSTAADACSATAAVGSDIAAVNGDITAIIVASVISRAADAC